MDDKNTSQQKAGFLHIAGLILLGTFLLTSIIAWVAQYAETPDKPASIVSTQK